MSRFFTKCLFLTAAGCSSLHHIQVGELDDSDRADLEPIDITVEVATVDAEAMASVVTDRLSSIVAAFAMGPRTGMPLAHEEIGQDVVHRMFTACPSGRITGVVVRRETRRVPLGGTEIIRIKGYCIVR